MTMVLIIWTSLTFLSGIVVANLVYRMQGGLFLHNLEQQWFGAFARELVLFVFMVGIPFLALINGASGLDLMALGSDLASPGNIIGFTLLNWLRAIGIGLGIVTIILFVLFLGSRTSPQIGSWNPGIIAFRNALYNEVHWTFYRAAPILLLGDVYWGTLAGTALVFVEWITHPERPTLTSTTEGRTYLVIELACLLSSAFIYLSARHLWVMILANLVIQLVGSHLMTRRISNPLVSSNGN